MPANSPNTALRVDATSVANQTPQSSRGETISNKIGNIAIRANNLVSVASNDVVTQGFALVEDEVNNFAQNSKILMGALDDIGKLHPFIQFAVSLFKAGLTLELTRPENDKKVLALNARMLNQVKEPMFPGPGGLTIEVRLKERMITISDTIALCAKVSDSYQKRHTLVKIVTSLKWQTVFTSVAQRFLDHKTALLDDLQIHTSIGIATANTTLNAIFEDVRQLDGNLSKVMEFIFEQMRSPEEREVASLVMSQLGAVDGVMKSDALLERVVSKGKTKDGKGARRQGDVEEDKAMSVAELKQEANKTVEEVLADNKYFEQKFALLQRQVSDVKETVKHESDRVVKEILSGPHERIVDRHIYDVWKEMGWKGSVKAKHLVMALRDHFAEGGRSVLAPEDQWTLDYITVLRVRPLIEALDDDVSSFVTVAEVNAFTAARPLKWSLPHWISYWTYGFEMTLQWYFRRIRKTYLAITSFSNAALPANIKAIASFLTSWPMEWTEDVLSGLRDVEAWDAIDWEDDSIFFHFRSYVVENEMQMERRLRSVRYWLDDTNTLTIVAGEGRPEKYILPLIFLLVRRAMWIIKQAGSVTLHERELTTISDSLSTLADAVRDRVCTLRAMYTLQNQNEKDQLSKFFYGLYRYAFEDAETGPFWRRSLTTDAFQIVDHVSADVANTEDPIPLLYGPQVEDLELIAYQGSENEESLDSSCAPTRHSLIGHWNGSSVYNIVGGHGGDSESALLSFTISTLADDGSVCGSGIDPYGTFTITGTLAEGHRLTLSIQYAIQHSGNKGVYEYKGTLNEEQDELAGIWGVSVRGFPSIVAEMEMKKSDGEGDEGESEGKGDSEGGGNDVNSVDGTPEEAHESTQATIHEDPVQDSKNSPPPWQPSPASFTNTTQVQVLGTFSMKRHSLEYLLARPSSEEFAHNRPRALWKLAINFTVAAVRRRTLSWGALWARRRQLELLKSKQRVRMDPERWLETVKGIRLEDLHLLQCTVTFHARREPINRRVTFRCDSCGIVPGAPAGEHERTSVSRSHYMCIECSQDEVDNTMDLCAGCFSDRKAVTRGVRGHNATHAFLQFRTPRMRVLRPTLFSAARSALRREADLVDMERRGALCFECKVQITGPPYWCCVECHNHTFICYKCNKRTEEERPWLVQWTANPDFHATHDWSHVLVSVPDPHVAGEKAERSRSSVEGRLASLEQKLDNQSAALTAHIERLDRQSEGWTSRLEKLEGLLERLLSAQGA